MRFLRKSSAEEYAHSFWLRENLKNGADVPNTPAECLAKLKRPFPEGHPYKLPSNPILKRWGVWLLTSAAEMENLMVIQDEYMGAHDFRVVPPTLVNVVRRAIHTGYFDVPNGGTQYRLFHEWKDHSLEGRIKEDERLCLRVTTDKEKVISPTSSFYITDGWGRALPYLTLVTYGHEFYPVEAYVAE